jgi:hypothetical protein
MGGRCTALFEWRLFAAPPITPDVQDPDAALLKIDLDLDPQRVGEQHSLVVVPPFSLPEWIDRQFPIDGVGCGSDRVPQARIGFRPNGRKFIQRLLDPLHAKH